MQTLNNGWNSNGGGGGSHGHTITFQELVGTHRVHKPHRSHHADVAQDQTHRPNQHHTKWTAQTYSYAITVRYTSFSFLNKEWFGIVFFNQWFRSLSLNIILKLILIHYLIFQVFT